MKKLLAVGDSLLAGHYGESPLNHSDQIERFHLINRGQNGEPMKGILRNLEVHLRTNHPDILLLDGGANDLLIPYMQKNHPKEWGPFIRKMERHESIAASGTEEFGSLLNQGLNQSLKAGVEKIIVLTIPVLCENLEHPLQKGKKALNATIRQIVASDFPASQVYLADLSEEIDKALLPLQPGSDWLFQSPIDLEKDRTAAPAEERGLFFTIDGVHLNSRGAGLCGSVLDQILKTMAG